MTPYKPQNLLKSSRDPKKRRTNNSATNRNAGGSGGGGSRASRRAELSSLLSAGGNSTGGNGKGTLGEEGRDSPLAASSEDLSTRSGSPRYNSTFNDDTLTK